MKVEIEYDEEKEIILKFKYDTLINFLKKMDHEYHLPEYEAFLDEIDAQIGERDKL